MKKTIAFLVVGMCCMFLLCNAIFAQDAVSIYEEEEFGEELVQELLKETPEHLKELFAELGIYEVTPQELLDLKPFDFLRVVAAYGKEYLMQPISGITMVFGMVLLCAIIEIFQLSFAGQSLGTVFSMVSALGISVILVSAAMECIQKTCQAITEFSHFMTSYIPIFSGIMIAAGQPVTGNVYQVFLFAACQIIGQVAQSVLVPLLGIYLAFSLVGGVNPGLKLDGITNVVKNSTLWLLSLMLMIFVALMSFQSIVATGSDTLATKAGKFLIGSFVPLVGSTISDLYLSVQGCFKLIKTCVGSYGILAAGLMFAPLLIQITVWRLSILAAEIVAQILNAERAHAVLRAIGTVFTVLLALLLTFALLMIISTTLMLLLGIGG